MGIKIYEYSGCSTCKKALRFLEERNITFKSIPIAESPPSLSELREMVSYLQARGSDFKKLFNTTGVLYREMKISEKLKSGMTEAEALKLLTANGKLIKRPFLLAENSGTVGFDETEWKKIF